MATPVLTTIQASASPEASSKVAPKYPLMSLAQMEKIEGRHTQAMFKRRDAQRVLAKGRLRRPIWRNAPRHQR